MRSVGKLIYPCLLVDSTELPIPVALINTTRVQGLFYKIVIKSGKQPWGKGHFPITKIRFRPGGGRKRVGICPSPWGRSQRWARCLIRISGLLSSGEAVLNRSQYLGKKACTLAESRVCMFSGHHPALLCTAPALWWSPHSWLSLGASTEHIEGRDRRRENGLSLKGLMDRGSTQADMDDAAWMLG